MNTRPRLTRSIAFWLLIGGSLAAATAGALILVDKLRVMEAALTDGTATGVEVYVGQIWAVLGAILIGAGVIGLALAAAVGALRAIAPAPAAIAEPTTDTDDAGERPLALEDADVEASEPGPTVAR